MEKVSIKMTDWVMLLRRVIRRRQSRQLLHKFTDDIDTEKHKQK